MDFGFVVGCTCFCVHLQARMDTRTIYNRVKRVVNPAGYVLEFAHDHFFNTDHGKSGFHYLRCTMTREVYFVQLL